MKMRFVLLTYLLPAIAIASGCGDDGNTSAESGTDVDTDTDTDTDSDTDTDVFDPIDHLGNAWTAGKGAIDDAGMFRLAQIIGKPATTFPGINSADITWTYLFCAQCDDVENFVAIEVLLQPTTEATVLGTGPDWIIYEREFVEQEDCAVVTVGVDDLAEAAEQDPPSSDIEEIMFILPLIDPQDPAYHFIYYFIGEAGVLAEMNAETGEYTSAD